MEKKIVKKSMPPLLILFLLVGLGAAGWFGFKFFKQKQAERRAENAVMDVVVHEKGVSKTLDGKVVGTGRRLDGIYAKDDLTFYNKTVALQTPPQEMIQELNQIGLTREQMIASIASLLALVDDEMRAKNMTTDYIASLGFQLTGDEYIKLLESAKIADEFYYMNVIKNSIAYVQFPLTSAQEDKVLSPLKTGDYRSRGKTLLEREAAKQQTP